MPTPNKNSGSKIFDVSKPGKTTPDATARPIIVGHKAMIQDPMVNNDSPPAEDKPKDDTTAPAHTNKIIQPPEEESDAADEPAKTDDNTVKLENKDSIPPEEPEAPDSEKSSETAEPAEESGPEPKSESSDEATDGDSAAVGELASQAAKSKSDAQNEDKQKAKQEALDKLIADKKYYVPVGHVQKRGKNHSAIFIILMLFVALATVYAMVDAGIVDIGIEVPVDLIKN